MADGFNNLSSLPPGAGGQDMIRQKVALDDLKRRLATPGQDDTKLREAAQGFEAMFIKKLWSQMRATVPKEGYLHSKEEESYLSMFDEEFSKKMAASGGIGLGDMLYEQLRSKTAEAGRHTTPSRASEPLPVRSLAERRNVVDTTIGKKLEPFVNPLENLYTPVKTEIGTSTEEHTSTDMLSGNMFSGKTLPGAAPAADLTSAEAAPVAQAASPEVAAKVNGLARRIMARQGPAQGEGGPAPLDRSERPAMPRSGNGNDALPALHWPVDGRLSSGFGWRTDPFTGQRQWHSGIDLAASKGEPVKACWDGEVVFAGKKGGYGNLVVLEHAGGWRSSYAHSDNISVEPGDLVEAGRVIAQVGSTGRSTGPHLHFELQQGEQAWDPQMIRGRLLAGLSVGNG
jgi:peptidoglycan hydrolase FlgJ